jgi:RNA polymerase sigma-70 factor (ECF subfamily)
VLVDETLRSVPSSPAVPASPQLSRLLQQVAGGDRGAFADFYDATVSVVSGMALVAVKDQHRAEALTHDVYITAWASAPLCSSHVTPIAWLTSLMASHLRSAPSTP